MVDKHIDDNLPNLGESPFDNAGYFQDNMFEESKEGIENIQHHSDSNYQDLSITTSNSLNLYPESHNSYAELYKSKVEGTFFHVYMFLLNTNCIYIFRKKEYEITKLNWEQQKWHQEKDQKDKKQHMELTISEKEIQFAKNGRYKELEVRI
ncbi:hypothetical protein BY996DRAFT_6473764 [Phakopsora pachyrhizi]|nr:hypothetical protein BY996DRAFT_6473764 [Phakopsora pachyrhizi]